MSILTKFRKPKEETFDVDNLIPVGSPKVYKEEQVIKDLQKEITELRRYKRILVRVVESLTYDSQFREALETYFLENYKYEVGSDGKLQRKKKK